MADNQKLACPLHNIKIPSQTSSCLPVFSKSFVLFCFAFKITEMMRVDDQRRLSGSALQQLLGGTLPMVGLLLCWSCKSGVNANEAPAIRSPSMWLSVHHTLPHLPSQPICCMWRSWGYASVLHLSLNHQNYVNLALGCHTPADILLALFDYRHMNEDFKSLQC